MFAKLLAVLGRKMKPGATFKSECNSLSVMQLRPTLLGQLWHRCYYPKWVVVLHGDNWNKEWKIDGEVMKGEGHEYEIALNTTITGYGYQRRLSLSWTGNVKAFNLATNEICFLTPKEDILEADGKCWGRSTATAVMMAS